MPRRPPSAAGQDPAALTRRAFAGAALGFVCTHDVLAMAADAEKAVNQTVSEHARPTTHPDSVRKLKRWTPRLDAPLDLARPLDNHHAFAKVQANLAGTDSWLAQYGWVLMCPPGKAAYPILGRVLLVKVFATPTAPDWAPDVDEHSYTMWGTFTTAYVDPRTFAPVSKIFNPYIGKTIDVPTLHYADRLVYRLGRSIIVPGVAPAFYDQPWDRDGGYSQHHVVAGEEVSYTVLGAAQHDGPHQPRLDVGFWTVKRAELVDPARLSIETRRDYSAIMKASEYAWYGVGQGDPAQLKVHLTGLKTQDVTRIPELVRKVVLDRFPERFA
jgi:hypothetical protein